MFTPY